MRYIYLDASVLVAYYAKGAKSEPDAKELIGRALQVFKQLENVELCVSKWAVSEMVVGLIDNKSMGKKEVAKISNDLVRTSNLGTFAVRFVDVCPDADYTFDSFFLDSREIKLLYNPGWGDAMHSVIMKNNKIKEILTIDDKDYSLIPDITVLLPRNIKFPIKPILKITPS